MPEVDTIPRAASYVAAVEHLMEGRPTEALSLLEPIVQTSPAPGALLALGKCYLELRRPAEARSCFRRLLDSAPAEAGFQAYVRLLDASGAALAGDLSGAEASLDEIVRIDPRLEVTVRSFRRQIQSGRAPLLRL